MKIRLLISSLAFIIVALPAVRAEEAKPAPAPAPASAPAAQPERPETELEKTMSKMGKAWRSVRKAARDGKLGPANAQAVATVRENAELAAKMTPMLEAEQPAADRAKFQADYEAQMKKLVATLTSLEAALKADDTAQATKLVGEVGDLMKEGHHEFKKPEQH